VPALFLMRVGETPGEPAYLYPSDGGWKTLTWRDTEARVRAIAGGLRALGLAAEERCSILCSTRYEWILVDHAVLCAGGATTTIYPSSTAEDCAYILHDSSSAYAFVEDATQLAKLLERRADIPSVRKVIVVDGASTGDPWVLSLAELEELGRAEDARYPGRFEEVAGSVRPDALATLMYTSGTTGRPKGVELLHGGWVAQAKAIERSGVIDHPERLQYFWLPLSHSFGKMITAAQMWMGFPTAVDGRIERLVENLAVVRPTFMCAVPRIFEKVHNRIVSQAQGGGRLRYAVFRWALDVGRERARLELAGRKPGPLLAMRARLADRLVFSRIRALFGGRLRCFISGAAPLSRDVAEVFFAAGLPILEGYGLTETSAATHTNRPGRPRIGTVGPPLPGIEQRVAADGEVLLRGPWVMRAYHDLPEATAEALADGWLHTGDVGVIDGDGSLTITDRKKDLIKTSGGKYIAPQEIEGLLKARSPIISQVLVHGDRRAYVTALVTLDALELPEWAERRGITARSPADLAADPKVQAEVHRAVDEMNAELPRFSTVKRFTILPQEFSEAAGEVTPSQKVKRKLVEERYAAVLDSMYAETRRAP
jgi:long-chain acyl-CoA synthetase